MIHYSYIKRKILQNTSISWTMDAWYLDPKFLTAKSQTTNSNKYSFKMYKKKTVYFIKKKMAGYCKNHEQWQNSPKILHNLIIWQICLNQRNHLEYYWKNPVLGVRGPWYTLLSKPSDLSEIIRGMYVCNRRIF